VKKWEYLARGMSLDNAEEGMTLHGGNGWELVSVVPIGDLLGVFFKREITEKVEE